MKALGKIKSAKKFIKSRGSRRSVNGAPKASKRKSMKKDSHKKKKTWWQYVKEWHDKRVKEIFGGGKGKKLKGREYDARYKGRDIEYKSSNFGKGPRSKSELEHMEKQIDKDIKYKRSGDANPHWHFEHDPSKAPEMKPLLDKLDKAGISWTHGSSAPF
ncbi:MAG TPA: hypothetical protein VF941_19405 [Clostridia bacterium]